jgi:hypothetical protein
MSDVMQIIDGEFMSVPMGFESRFKIKQYRFGLDGPHRIVLDY